MNSGSKPIGPVAEQYPVLAPSGGLPVNVAEYERAAKNTLPKNAHDYYASGSNDMITLRENRDAFSRLRIIPRALVDVSRITMKSSILGNSIASPICIAPTAMQQMAHPDGECATARAAGRLNTLMCISSWSTMSLEEAAAACPEGLRWFQLYVYKDRSVVIDLVRRAEKAGYKALAVTVDTPILGRREADIRNNFALPSHLTLGNFAKAGGVHATGVTTGAKPAENGKPGASTGSGLAAYVSSLIDRTLTWKDIAWLRSITTLPIVVKGIMSVADAVLAVENGVDAVWVSNHGARQLDTCPATIEVLPDIVRAVAGRVEVYVDGGITRGTDAFKAIALGARAVFVGRPVLWGLARSGEEGVHHVMTLLNDELQLAMALAGVCDVKGIEASFIRTTQSLQCRL
jgi:(S)-2-hydroxy-acid oxidase